MYRCDGCGKIFEEPLRVREDMNGEGWAIDEYNVSPCCNDSYQEVYLCACCGEEYVDYDDYCTNCIDKLSKKLDQVQHDLGVDYETMQGMLQTYVER